MVIIKEPSDGILNICVDSWAVYRGLMFWIAPWATQDWTIHARPVWSRDMWLEIWNVVRHRTVHVHISGHQPLQSKGNNEADNWLKFNGLRIRHPRTLPTGYLRSCGMWNKRQYGQLLNHGGCPYNYLILSRHTETAMLAPK